MYKKIILIAIIALASLLTLAFSLKSTIFRFVLAQKVQTVESKFNISINYSNATVKGLKYFQIKNLEVKHLSKGICLSLHDVDLEMSFLRLIRFGFMPRTVTADSILLAIQEDGILDTFDSSSKMANVITYERLINIYSQKLIKSSKPIYNILKGVEFNLNNFECRYSDSLCNLKISSNQLISQNGSFTSTLSVLEGDTTTFINLISQADIASNELIYWIKPQRHFTLPIIESRLGLHFGFDSLSFTIRGKKITSDSINLDLNSSFFGVKLRHQKLSDSTVTIDYAKVNLSSYLSSNTIRVVAPSFATINMLSVPFEANIRSTDKLVFSFNISTGDFPAANIFESIPKGLFKNIQNAKATGDVNLKLGLFIDFNYPDSLRFFAKLEPVSFKLLSTGVTDLTRLNRNFIHLIPINDSLYKSIPIDSSSIQFRPLCMISRHVVNAVVISEDGGFFYHKGFDAEGFSYALARNIKDRRLARGGSTITMQLVKNLYLNRNKTLARKAEEALIVWLIETQRLASKERILEIYLNIIDWGPNINGITEASRFYFKKDPLEINLNEAIFLAGIIPQPANFPKFFDSNKNLKDYMIYYFQSTATTMLKRSMITEEEFEILKPEVEIVGAALEYMNRLDYLKGADFTE